MPNEGGTVQRGIRECRKTQRQEIAAINYPGPFRRSVETRWGRIPVGGENPRDINIIHLIAIVATIIMNNCTRKILEVRVPPRDCRVALRGLRFGSDEIGHRHVITLESVQEDSGYGNICTYLGDYVLRKPVLAIV
jgi:hypothetical protein